MSYTVMGSLFNRRDDAVRALVEAFLWADGQNQPSDVVDAARHPDATADELVVNWHTRIADGDEVSRGEILDTIRSIVAVSYESGIDDAAVIYDESTAREIAAEDPGLIIWVR